MDENVDMCHNDVGTCENRFVTLVTDEKQNKSNTQLSERRTSYACQANSVPPHLAQLQLAASLTPSKKTETKRPHPAASTRRQPDPFKEN